MRKPPIILLLAVALTADAPQAAEAEGYGAIAIDESAWAFAFAGGRPSKAVADQQALSLCAKEGGERCEIKYRYTGSRCAAAAVAEEQGLSAWWFGHANSRAGAIDTAMSYCKSENTGGGTCRRAAVSCSERADSAPQEADASEAAPQAADEAPYGYGAYVKGDHQRDPYFFSTGHSNAAEAQRAVESKCEQALGTGRCPFTNSFTERCYAWATSQTRREYPWVNEMAVADSEAGAISEALSACRVEIYYHRHTYVGLFCRVGKSGCAEPVALQAADADGDKLQTGDHIDRGIAKYKQKDYEGAKADFDRAIELNPEDAEAYYWRGTATKYWLGDYEGSKTDLNQAIELKPDYASAYSNRGATKYDLGDHEGAEADWKWVIENIKPDDAKAYYQRGFSKYRLDDHEGAIADFDRAIELNTDYAPAYLFRGFAKSELGDDEGSKADLNRSNKLFGNMETSLFRNLLN